MGFNFMEDFITCRLEELCNSGNRPLATIRPSPERSIGHHFDAIL
jgi:hypothetical protein